MRQTLESDGQNGNPKLNLEARNIDLKAIMQDSWEFHSLDDIRRFWTAVRSIPSRAEGREHYHEEQYSLGLLSVEGTLC